MTPTWLGDLEQGTAPPWPLLSTNRPLSLSFPISKNHGSWSESWMITEGPSQGPMSHGLHLSLPLPPRRSVSFETTLVPLPAHLEPHLSPKGKAMLKISETISRQLGGGDTKGEKKGQNWGQVLVSMDTEMLLIHAAICPSLEKGSWSPLLP